MKNIKFSGPFAAALMAALIDIIGALSVVIFDALYLSKGSAFSIKWEPWAAKFVDGLFVIFIPLYFIPILALLSPLIWALGGIVFYYLRRAIRNGAFHIAR